MNNLQPSSATQPTPQEIRISLTGLGHVPSFKNTKSIARRKNGSPMIITNPVRKEWMEEAIRIIESQLLSKFRTTFGGTGTVAQLRSWIASSMPLDDCRQWIPELHVSFVEVPKGEEGAEIVVTRL